MQLIILLISLSVCVTVHEAAHAWVAYKLGDPTAKIQGRVSLNPLRHMDLLGTIMIFIASFGWGKPVQFNINNLKNPKRDAALISFAGPFTNLLTALVIALSFKYFTPTGFILNLLRTIFTLSIYLFLFNLLPIAPLDGSKLIGLVVPKSMEELYFRYISQGPLYIFLLILSDRLINEIFNFSFFGTYLQFGFDFISTIIFLNT